MAGIMHLTCQCVCAWSCTEIPLLQTDHIIAPSLIFLGAAPPSCCQQVRLLACWHTPLLPELLSDLLSQQQPALALLQAVGRQERSERSSAACC